MVQSKGPEIVTLNSSLIDNDQLRLDAAYYEKTAIHTDTLIRKGKCKIETIGDLADIKYLTRFKRVWLDDDSSGGVPYLSASETLLSNPLRHRFISKREVKNADDYFAKKDWILIECSGTIGVPIYVNKTLEKYFLDNHLLRLIPRKGTLSGYLYAYLYSKFGQTLLKRGQYGSVVKEIDPRQVNPIPIPKLPQEIQKKIHDKILHASELRDEANKLEQDAIKLLEKNIENFF